MRGWQEIGGFAAPNKSVLIVKGYGGASNYKQHQRGRIVIRAYLRCLSEHLSRNYPTCEQPRQLQPCCSRSDVTYAVGHVESKSITRNSLTSTVAPLSIPIRSNTTLSVHSLHEAVSRFRIQKDEQDPAKLFLEKLRLAQKDNGRAGVMVVARKAFRSFRHLATDGDTACEIWQRLSQAAAENEQDLYDLINFAGQHGRHIPDFYWNTLSLAILSKQRDLVGLHNRLRTTFPPTDDDHARLFRLCVCEQRLHDFERICHHGPCRVSYETVVPHLCFRNLHEDAFYWHRILVQLGRGPQNQKHVSALLMYLATGKSQDRFAQVLGDSKHCLFLGHKNLQICSRQDSNAEALCARLFATPLLGVESIIRGLGMFGASTLGDLALRELLVRAHHDPRVLRVHLNHLHRLGVRLSHSKYATLIQAATIRNNGPLLKAIGDCDAHPDTYDDLNTQERMLAHALAEGNTAQADRAMAIILLETRQDLQTLQYTNALVRAYVTNGNTDQAKILLDQTSLPGSGITSRTSRHVRHHRLKQRKHLRLGVAEVVLQDIELTVNVMKRAQQCGNPAPPRAWREILKRMGMHGRLEQLRNLSLWLVQWFRVPEKQYEHQSQAFADIFDPSLQHAILAWSFQIPFRKPRAVKNGQGSMDIEQPANTRASTSVRQTVPADDRRWMQGLVLLRDLQACGVPINRDKLVRSCAAWLDQIFGRSLSKRSLYRNAVLRENKTRLDYLTGMGSIWGAKFADDVQERFHFIERLRR